MVNFHACPDCQRMQRTIADPNYDLNAARAENERLADRLGEERTTRRSEDSALSECLNNVIQDIESLRGRVAALEDERRPAG